MMKRYLCLLILILFFPLTVLAQTQQEQEEEEDDPFKRELIYAPTIDELIEGDPFEYDETEFERNVRHLSTSGLDLGGGFEAGPYYSNSLYSQYPNLSTVHYNRVNGLYIGLKKERMQWFRRASFLTVPEIQPHGFIGIGTASRTLEYGFGLERLFGERERLMIGAEYHKATATEDYWRTGLIENTLTSLFASYDYLDYYQLEGLGIYAVYRTNRLVEAAFSYNNDKYSSLEQNTSFSLFGYANTYRPNPPVDRTADEINLDKYNFSLSLNPRNVLISNRFTISSTLGIELADNARSDEAFRFNKYWTNLNIFYNVDEGAVLRWRLRSGSITGNAPDFKTFYLGGVGSLRGSPYKFYSGNQMFHSTAEIQFGSPGNRPGSWVENYNMHLLVFLDSGWTRQNPDLVNTTNPFEGFGRMAVSDFQHDAGIGAGTAALRVELAWPLNNFEPDPTFWIRFNPTF